MEYTLAFTSATLDKYCSKWSAVPKTGFIDITTSKDFYRVYSGLQFVSKSYLYLQFFIKLEMYLDSYFLIDLVDFPGLQGYMEDSVQTSANNHEVLGDSVAWGGCTIIYLLGQQIHFELFDFSYQLLNVAEVETATITQTLRSANYVQVKP